ncbi:MAG TPA: serine--tRNA ligase, partial [Candidatus Kapabacteria bacterium]|nr:serine--tRNA ligase [Candidatus Kapabacteria bacterium]
MLDIKLIRENPDVVRAAIAAKHSEDVVDQILEFDRERRAIIQQVEVLKQERNTVSEEIAKLKRAKEPAEQRIADMKAVGDEIAALDGELRGKELSLSLLMDSVPNVLHSSVPVGVDATSNVEIKRWAPGGDERLFENREGLDHLTLGEKHQLFDFKRGAK